MNDDALIDGTGTLTWPFDPTEPSSLLFYGEPDVLTFSVLPLDGGGWDVIVNSALGWDEVALHFWQLMAILNPTITLACGG